MSRQYRGKLAEEQYRQGYSDGWREATQAMNQMRMWFHPDPLAGAIHWLRTEIRTWLSQPYDHAVEAPELDAEHFQDS